MTDFPEQSPDANDSEAIAIREQERAALLQRAQSGDKSVLQEARNPTNHTDVGIYEEVLNSLVELADSDTKLLSLVSYVQRHELPVNQNLAENFMNSCKTAPGRSSATKMLHVAALSDDAELYQSAVVNALDFWRNGHLTGSLRKSCSLYWKESSGYCLPKSGGPVQVFF